MLGLCTHSGIYFWNSVIILTFLKEEVLVQLPKHVSAVVFLQFSASDHMQDPLPSHVSSRAKSWVMYICLVHIAEINFLLV